MASERAGLSGHISERDIIAFLEYKELTRFYFIITSQTKMIQICHKTRGAVIPLFPDEQAVFFILLYFLVYRTEEGDLQLLMLSAHCEAPMVSLLGSV